MISTWVNRKINPLTQYLDATYPLQSTQINGIDMDAKNVHRTRLGASSNRISGLGVSQPKRLAYLCFTVNGRGDTPVLVWKLWMSQIYTTKNYYTLCRSENKIKLYTIASAMNFTPCIIINLIAETIVCGFPPSKLSVLHVVLVSWHTRYTFTWTAVKVIRHVAGSLPDSYKSKSNVI